MEVLVDKGLHLMFYLWGAYYIFIMIGKLFKKKTKKTKPLKAYPIANTIDKIGTYTFLQFYRAYKQQRDGNKISLQKEFYKTHGRVIIRSVQDGYNLDVIVEDDGFKYKRVAINKKLQDFLERESTKN